MMKRINIAALAIALLCGVAGNAATVSDEDWLLRFDVAEEANDQDTLADIALNGKVWVTEWEACPQCKGAGERPCPDHHEKRMVARVEKTIVDSGGSE